MQNLIIKFKNMLFKPVSPAPLAFVRIFFGIFGAIHALKFLLNDDWFQLNFKAYIIQPTYSLFPFVYALSLDEMRGVIVLMLILSIFICIGFLYRASIVLYTIFFTYLFLINRQFYQNHYYFILLVSFLLSFSPASLICSVDSLIFKTKKTTIPFYFQFLIMFQICVVYFFGGIAKLNPDWLNGYPIRIWIEHLDNFSFLNGPHSQTTAFLLSYGGLLFDLSIAFLLICGRTRFFGFVLVVLFHILNTILFNIGVFPYLSLILTLLFLSDSLFDKALFQKQYIQQKNKIDQRVFTLVSIWIAIQFIIPLRSYIFNFDPKWSQTGDMFSWRMRLHDYKGTLQYKIVDTNKSQAIFFDVETNGYRLFDDHQLGFVIRDPASIVAGAKQLAQEYFDHTGKMPEVFAISELNVDARSPQLFIDPNIDLVKIEPNLVSEDKILMPFKSERN
jgi:vitamin K-dependent gamma-carboxylase